MIPIAAYILGAGQSYAQHKDSLSKSENKFNKQVNQSIYFNEMHLKQNKSHHNIQYAHSLMSANREAKRDMWAQINQKNQTQIIMQTLLFSCSFGLLIEGTLPDNVTTVIACFYSITLSLSILLTFVALLCSIKLQSRMTRFNISSKYQVYTTNKSYINFEEYYKDYCYTLKIFSRWFNYIGVVSLFISGTILWYSRFMFTYNSPISAILFTSINSIALLLIIYMIVKVKTVTRYTYKENDISFEMEEGKSSVNRVIETKETNN
mgnify:CR=1 FL=1